MLVNYQKTKFMDHVYIDVNAECIHALYARVKGMGHITTSSN